MMAEFRIDDSLATHVGEVRSENEDSALALPEARLWLVADGMGGHVNGQYASREIVATVAATDFPEDIEAACDTLSAAVHTANTRIYERSIAERSQMGSTFVALLLRGDQFAVLWSGDSRAYVFRDGALFQLTQDHSQVQALIDSGLLTPQEAADHPMRHVLARAVGVEEDLQIDAVRDFVNPRDLFLLCSDGLHGLISDDQIAAILAHDGVLACDALVAECLARGAPDNITVTLVAVSETTLLALGETR
jgi:serine/threonine protein phosphatase Stp1